MPIASKPGRYTICLDHNKKIVRVGQLGVVTVSEVDEYVEALKKVLVEIRGKWGRVRVLADLRNAPVRLPDAAERMRFGNLHLYRQGDRVAILVESSILKMQLRRNLVADYQELFLSENAAEMWLFT